MTDKRGNLRCNKECKEITDLLIQQIQEKNKIIKKLETERASARSKTLNNNKQRTAAKSLKISSTVKNLTLTKVE